MELTIDLAAIVLILELYTQVQSVRNNSAHKSHSRKYGNSGDVPIKVGWLFFSIQDDGCTESDIEELFLVLYFDQCVKDSKASPPSFMIIITPPGMLLARTLELNARGQVTVNWLKHNWGCHNYRFQLMAGVFR